MTIERQALVERLRKLATERATNGGGNDPCPPEAECDDCDSVRAMREAADALEALSSSAPVETPLVATDAESEPHKPKIRVHETMGGFWRVVVSGRDENQDDRYALMPLGRGQTRAEAVANARAWFAQVDPASPADPPIPSPGDEERKDEIATSARQVKGPEPDRDRMMTAGDRTVPVSAEEMGDVIERLNREARYVAQGNSYGRDVLAPLLRTAVEYLEALTSPSGWQQRIAAPEDGTPFHAYGPDLVDEDFNPNGVVEATSDGEGGFVGAIWNNEQDCWDTRPIKFTHWRPIPKPPHGLPGLPASPAAVIAASEDAPVPCKARRCSTPEPQDCDWPFCGCDPHADRVIAHLQEIGMLRTIELEAQFATARRPFKLDVTKEWCERMAHLEAEHDGDITAGSAPQAEPTQANRTGLIERFTMDLWQTICELPDRSSPASPARFCECIGVAGHPNFVRTQHGRSVCVHCDLPRRADASPAKETRDDD